jgi:hypothetical protein
VLSGAEGCSCTAVIPCRVVIAGIAGGVVVVAIVVLLVAWARRRSLAASDRVASLLDRAALVIEDRRAQFYGRESLGRTQTRGNGHLALTDQQLVFTMWVPAKTVTIQRDSITSVETRRGFLGKTGGARLLCVSWTDPAGTDRGAWRVRDLDAWLSALVADNG